MKERGIAFLAWLWLFLKSIWLLLIIGAAAGVLGNMAYSYFTTGMVPFTDPRTLTLTSLSPRHF